MVMELSKRGEGGLTAVTVQLQTTGGSVVETKTTSANGEFLFSSVDPGSYLVVATTPTGFSPTNPTTASVSIGSGGSTSTSFGFQGQGTVSGTIFNDVNGDGSRQAGEPGISGQTILLTQGGVTKYTATSTSDGSYVVPVVVAGSYIVECSTPSGFNPTSSTTKAVTVTSGSSASANFGFELQSSVNGVVFNDVNGNGTQDSGEAGISGITVTLAKSGGSTITTATIGNGSYSFTGLTDGTYTVSVEPDDYPTNFIVTTTPSRQLVLDSEASNSINFGFQEQGLITGTVFNDINGSSTQDLNESGLSGVTVTLKDSGGTTITSTETVSDGSFSFGSRDAGSYIIEATQPSGFIATTSTSASVVVPAGGSASAQFGFQQTGLISGTVFSDINGDGIKQTGEPGLSGVTVTLKQGATTITSTTTIANGSYSFAGQEAGNYTIEVTTPADFSPTTPLSESVSLVAGGSSQANFGFQQEGSISGLVFLDLNGNGSLDANEIGIAGVQVQLDGSSPVTTVGDGSFIFRGKTPGTYEVSLVSIPSGYNATTLTARTIVLEAGASVSVNFGLQQTGAVTGNIFNDLNGSGAQDPNEPGIAGVTVALLYDSITLTTNSLGNRRLFI